MSNVTDFVFIDTAWDQEDNPAMIAANAWLANHYGKPQFVRADPLAANQKLMQMDVWVCCVNHLGEPDELIETIRTAPTADIVGLRMLMMNQEEAGLSTYVSGYLADFHLR